MGGGGQHAAAAGDENQTVPPSPRPFRHRRRAPPSAAVIDSGIDHPPSVTYPSLQHAPCVLNVRTAQHLCSLVHPQLHGREEEEEEDVIIPTGTAPCDPVIAFGRYVVSATDDGRICFYSVRQQSQDACRPVAIVEIDSDSTIAGLVAAPEGVSLVRYRSTADKERLLTPPDFLGHLVAISTEGNVHIIECNNGNGQVKKLFSWNTGMRNISCVTVRPDRSGQWRISLGYQSGTLEEWQISIPVRKATSKEPTPSISASEDKQGTTVELNEADASSLETEWKPLMRRVFPQLLFRGFFDLPIRSLSSIGEDKDQSTNDLKVPIESDKTNEELLLPELKEENDPKETVTTDEETKEAPIGEEQQAKEETHEKPKEKEPQLTEKNDTRDYLSVCLVMNPRVCDESLGRPASSSQIDVIHVSTLERDWNTLLEQEQEHIKANGTRDMALPLQEYCVWPHVGMEILDTASMPANDEHLSRRIRGLPSQGSDRMCVHTGADPFFAAALSDGNIARLRAAVEDGTLSWGVHNDCDQVVLSYPAIGIAPVKLSTGTHIACCLRGGTVYLVPDSEHLEPISVILAPVDTEQETCTHYIQGFTAGNVIVDGLEQTVGNDDLAVLVFSTAGGILEVYACSLLSQTEQDSTLLELVENGPAELLRDLLCLVEEDDPLLVSDAWKKSRDELMLVAKNDSLTAEMLRSSSFTHTRTVLMKLSEKDSDIK